MLGRLPGGRDLRLRTERIITEAFLSAASKPYAERVSKAGKKQLGVHEDDREPDTDEKLEEINKSIDRALELLVRTPGPQVARLEKKLEALETQAYELRKQQASRTAGSIAAEKRNADIDTFRKRINNLPKIWEVATTEERNQMLRLAVKRITVRGEGRPKVLGNEWGDWLNGGDDGHNALSP